MRTRDHEFEGGIALVMVMLVIVVLAVIAGGFAYSMRVETKLARNATFESDLEWLGRSGVELARYVLAQQLTVPNEPYDSLNQVWAGGPGTTNTVLAEISLSDVELGSGRFSVRIVDQERKFNINAADEDVLRQALMLVGVDAGETATISDSILDWRDTDDDPRLSGAESDYYLAMDPPYVAKNGPIDDLSELLLIQGVTPQVYWGYASSNLPPQYRIDLPPASFGASLGQLHAQTNYAVGLADIFTTISFRTININTASRATLQMIPGVDEVVADGIIAQRAGPDGMDGTDDDIPFQSVGELVNVPGLTQPVVAQLGRYAGVRSLSFEVHVDVQIGGLQREYVALLFRRDPQNVQVLTFHWQ